MFKDRNIDIPTEFISLDVNLQKQILDELFKQFQISQELKKELLENILCDNIERYLEQESKKCLKKK